IKIMIKKIHQWINLIQMKILQKEGDNISKDDNFTTSTYSRSALETYADVQNSDIVINLGKQVAVKKITIK
ncbi:hypothetical protein BM533_22765, partial [Clostridioides difficile]